ncbi:glycosyltransferase family 2 protein [Luteimonas sp. MJ250]|uniref:glycosyltransferase family 2 protein n=1 Tax=Luteimonas sp. MJ250 TaxID=3129236 RepID=UPI0031BACBF0
MPEPFRQPTLSIVSPVYGCAGCLEELVERSKRAFAASEHLEILLVDDGSPDDAWQRIDELARLHPEVRGLRLSRNFGQHAAIYAGLEHARGAHVVVMDCDLQDQPEEIPALLARARAGTDVIHAQRSARRDGIGKRLSSWCFYRVLAWLTGVPQDHRVANFGVYSRRVVELLLSMPESDRCFPLMVRWTGLPSESVPVAHAARGHGRSAYSLRKAARLALGVALSHSDKPLRLVVKAGMAVSLFAFGVVLAAVYFWASGRTGVAGYTSIIASIWLLCGILMFCVGVVGMYVGQVFKDGKRRPAFVVERELNPPQPGDA